MKRIFVAAVCIGISLCLPAQAQFITPPLSVSVPPSCCPPPPAPKCRTHFCSSPFGRLCCNVLVPFRVVTGGLVPKICCDVPTREELACMTLDHCSLAEIVAARIKRDEAEACGRRAAVRFLGTVDCHYYHEAEEALVAHLRADQNECVRFEAARVLGKGCCCTPRVIAALQIVVAGTADDGNPPERSERVRAAAVQALQVCLAYQADVVLPPDALFSLPPRLEVPDQPYEILPLPTPPPPPTAPLLPGAHMDIQLMSFTQPASPPRESGAADPLLEAQRVYAAHVGASLPDRSEARPGRSLIEILSHAAIAPAVADVPVPQSNRKKAEPPPPAETPQQQRVPARPPLTPIGLAPLGVLPANPDPR